MLGWAPVCRRHGCGRCRVHQRGDRGVAAADRLRPHDLLGGWHRLGGDSSAAPASRARRISAGAAASAGGTSCSGPQPKRGRRASRRCRCPRVRRGAVRPRGLGWPLSGRLPGPGALVRPHGLRVGLPASGSPLGRAGAPLRSSPKQGSRAERVRDPGGHAGGPPEREMVACHARHVRAPLAGPGSAAGIAAEGLAAAAAGDAPPGTHALPRVSGRTGQRAWVPLLGGRFGSRLLRAAAPSGAKLRLQAPRRGTKTRMGLRAGAWNASGRPARAFGQLHARPSRRTTAEPAAGTATTLAFFVRRSAKAAGLQPALRPQPPAPRQLFGVARAHMATVLARRESFPR